MSRHRLGQSEIGPMITPLAVVILPLLVPAPLMTGAGLLLVRLGKVKAGATMLRLGAGVQ